MELAATDNTPVNTDRARRMPGLGKLSMVTEQSVVAYKAPGSTRDNKVCCVGRVVAVNKPENVLSVHQYAASNDARLRVRWFPLYLGTEGELTPVPGARPSVERRRRLSFHHLLAWRPPSPRPRWAS